MKTQLFIINGNEKKNQSPILLKKYINLCGKKLLITIFTGAFSIPYEIAETNKMVKNKQTELDSVNMLL